MASTTSDTGDTSSKQQQAQHKENFNKCVCVCVCVCILGCIQVDRVDLLISFQISVPLSVNPSACLSSFPCMISYGTGVLAGQLLSDLEYTSSWSTASLILRSILCDNFPLFVVCCPARNGLFHRDIKPENILVRVRSTFWLCVHQTGSRLHFLQNVDYLNSVRCTVSAFIAFSVKYR